jgi:uncharacterized protein
VKISGSHTVDVPRERLWAALQDPAVLARTLPGCDSLQALGEDAYAATLTAGVASIKGTYTGQVQLHDKQEPGSYRLTAEGAGGPGTIRADATVRLEEQGGTTTVHYDADAVVGGMIGGVGQRMIAGAARRTAGEFFDAVADDCLNGPRVAAPAVAGAPAEVGVAGAPAGEEVGQVFAGRAAAPTAAAAGSRLDLLAAFALGAAAALLGVLVGRRGSGPSS